MTVTINPVADMGLKMPSIFCFPGDYQMAKRTNATDGDDEPVSPELLDKGNRFAIWINGALESSGKSVQVVAEDAGISRQTLYIYMRGCVGTDGKFRKPKESVIQKLALATRSAASDGLRAMGYSADAPKNQVPSAISALPPDAQQAIARLVQMLSPSEFVKVRILGSASASAPSASSDLSYPRAMLAQDIETIDGLFAITVERDDLEGEAIIDGDLVMFRPSSTATDGEIVAIEDVRGEAAIRRYRDDGGKQWVETVPANDEPKIVSVDRVKITGVKVALNRAG